MKKKIVHKGACSCHGIYNLCNNKIDSSKFSLYWEKVTCKKCKEMKKK